VQILWLLVQVVGRKIEGYAASLLEVTTVSYVVLAVATYILWWEKPKDIEEPCFIDVRLDIQDEDDRTMTWWRDFGKPRTKSMDAAYLNSAVFSAVHFAAWNYQFPTIIEMWLWRALAVWCFVAPVAFVTIATVVPAHKLWGSVWIRMILASYAVARFFLLVEIFATFRAAPVSVYESVLWSKYIMHWR